jgi:chromate reductase
VSHSLLGISGSLRRASFNTAVLHTLAAMLPPGRLRVVTLNDIPPYDDDLDGDVPPPAVEAFKTAIAASDGLVVCSPEYNFGMPGVLKNALDWASRPAGRSPLKGKPVLVMSASPGALGGARAHYQIRETLGSVMARVVVRPPVTIAAAAEKIRDGRLVHEPTIDFVLEAVRDLEREIALLQISAPRAA